MLQMPCQHKAISSIMIITISLTMHYDRRDFDRLYSIEDDVVKWWFRQLCAGSEKHSVKRLSRTSYEMTLTRQNFRRFNLSIPVVPIGPAQVARDCAKRSQEPSKSS